MSMESTKVENNLRLREEINSALQYGEALMSDKGYDMVIEVKMDVEYSDTIEKVPVLIGSKIKPEGLSASQSNYILYGILKDHKDLALDKIRYNYYFCKVEDLKNYIRTHFKALSKKPPHIFLNEEQFKEIFKPWE